MDQSWEQIDSGWDEAETEIEATDKPEEASRQRRTRARGKQKRRSSRTAVDGKPPGVQPRVRTREVRSQEHALGKQGTAGKRATPSWLIPAAVFVAAIGVFVLVLVATAN